MEKNMDNEMETGFILGIIGFAKIRGTFLGVPIIRTIIF